jgi:hypothetical protein
MVDIHKDDSPALQLLKLTWRSVAKGKSFAWRDVNQGMQEAMELAIKRGFVFRVGDFEYIAENMGARRWFGVTDNGKSRIYGEGFYSLACEVGNASAYQSFEYWMERKPFIIDGQRLHLRSRFDFRGDKLTVTSFDRASNYVVAVKYKSVMVKYPSGREYPEETRDVEQVFKITHADIYAWNKERRDGSTA